MHYERIPNPKMQPFVESGLWDPTLTGFPESRPEATDRAERDGASMGIAPKPSGNRPVQPVSDRFFYWLRATMLETRRLGYWWANRMLQTTHPVEQKMALLWHGHFATHENKVRDYRKMVQQIDLFERGRDRQPARARHQGGAEPRDAVLPRRAVQRQGRRRTKTSPAR